MSQLNIPSHIIRDQNYRRTNTEVFKNIQITGTTVMSANTITVSENTTFTTTPTISLLDLRTVGNVSFGSYPLIGNVTKDGVTTGQIKQFSVVLSAPNSSDTANCLRLSDNTFDAGNAIRLANVGDYGSLVFDGTDWKILNYGPSVITSL